MNQLQRSTGKTRRKTVNKRKQQQAMMSSSSSSSKVSAHSPPSPSKSDEDESTDEVNEAETAMENGEHDEQTSTPRSNDGAVNYQRDASTPVRDDSLVPSKPQASVAPVKQMATTNFYSKPYRNHSDYYQSRHNGYPSSNYHQSYSNHQNSLPPRFRQQIEQREAAMNNSYQQQQQQQQTFRRRRGRPTNYRTFYSSEQRHEYRSPSPSFEQEIDHGEEEGEGDVERHDDYEDEQQMPHPPPPLTHDHPPPPPPPSQQQQQQDYSSESELLSDTPSTNATTSVSSSVSTSVGSQSPLRGIELLRTLSNSNGLFTDLVALFDNVSFSTSELELLISKIATKHILNKQEVTRLLSTSTKTDKSVERILDETYLSQVKILAIELQAEKNRVVELTKSNAELDQTVRQLQQQQQAAPNLVQYQQAVLSHQMQLRQMIDENARLRHQLHAYSMMSPALNDLKQQHGALSEQLRQLTVRNSALENEAMESERASKHAAEIYKKADSQKQERIEQMIADINKYKKLDKELTALKQKHGELEKEFNEKVGVVVVQRDELKKKCELLEEQVKNDASLHEKYEKWIHHPSAIAKRQIEQEVKELKAKNDQLRQDNWKVIEKINELTAEKK